jgi:hypothetical protein
LCTVYLTAHITQLLGRGHNSINPTPIAQLQLLVFGNNLASRYILFRWKHFFIFAARPSKNRPWPAHNKGGIDETSLSGGEPR